MAVLEPALGRATVEKVAINAVMAGCQPEHLPVVLAATEAIAVPQLLPAGHGDVDRSARARCWSSTARSRSRIGMNAGRGALGPCRESAVNVVIGRAVRLVMVNCGYAYLGLFDLDTIGAPRKFSYCLAENEADSPFTPYHVDAASRPATARSPCSASVRRSMSTIWPTPSPRDSCSTYAGSAGSSGAPSTQHAYLELNHAIYKLQNLMLVPPDHAKVIADAGWSKQDAIDYVYRESFKEARLVLAACKPQAFRKEKLWATELDPSTKIPSMEGAGLPASRRGRWGGRERPVSGWDQRTRHRVNRPLPALSRPGQADVDRPGSAIDHRDPGFRVLALHRLGQQLLQVLVAHGAGVAIPHRSSHHDLARTRVAVLDVETPAIDHQRPDHGGHDGRDFRHPWIARCHATCLSTKVISYGRRRGYHRRVSCPA